MRYHRVRPRLPQMKRSALIVTIVPILGIAYLVYTFARQPWSAMRIVGLTLMTPALILLTIARIQLGNSFSVSPQATQLVTHGIYSRIRNPVYVFGTFVFIGLFLFLDRPLLLLFLLPVLILQIVRARAEARVLEQCFGEQYRQYRSTTWF
jgi:protein-S-isoprenylcysteine O-methyltransferase Ste14